MEIENIEKCMKDDAKLVKTMVKLRRNEDYRNDHES